MERASERKRVDIDPPPPPQPPFRNTHRQYFFDVYSRRLLSLHSEKKKCEDAFLTREEGDPRGAYDPPDPGTRRFKIQQQLLDTCVEEYNRVKAAMKRAFKDDTKSAASKKKKKRGEIDNSLVAITARLGDGLVPLQQTIDALSIELSAREREVRALEEYINRAEAEAQAAVSLCLQSEELRDYRLTLEPFPPPPPPPPPLSLSLSSFLPLSLSFFLSLSLCLFLSSSLSLTYPPLPPFRLPTRPHSRRKRARRMQRPMLQSSWVRPSLSSRLAGPQEFSMRLKCTSRARRETKLYSRRSRLKMSERPLFPRSWMSWRGERGIAHAYACMTTTQPTADPNHPPPRLLGFADTYAPRKTRSRTSRGRRISSFAGSAKRRKGRGRTTFSPTVTVVMTVMVSAAVQRATRKPSRRQRTSS